MFRTEREQAEPRARKGAHRQRRHARLGPDQLLGRCVARPIVVNAEAEAELAVDADPREPVHRKECALQPRVQAQRGCNATVRAAAHQQLGRRRYRMNSMDSHVLHQSLLSLGLLRMHLLLSQQIQQYFVL